MKGRESKRRHAESSEKDVHSVRGIVYVIGNLLKSHKMHLLTCMGTEMKAKLGVIYRTHVAVSKCFKMSPQHTCSVQSSSRL